MPVFAPCRREGASIALDHRVGGSRRGLARRRVPARRGWCVPQRCIAAAHPDSARRDAAAGLSPATLPDVPPHRRRRAAALAHRHPDLPYYGRHVAGSLFRWPAPRSFRAAGRNRRRSDRIARRPSLPMRGIAGSSMRASSPARRTATPGKSCSPRPRGRHASLTPLRGAVRFNL